MKSVISGLKRGEDIDIQTDIVPFRPNLTKLNFSNWNISEISSSVRVQRMPAMIDPQDDPEIILGSSWL